MTEQVSTTEQTTTTLTHEEFTILKLKAEIYDYAKAYDQNLEKLSNNARTAITEAVEERDAKISEIEIESADKDVEIQRLRDMIDKLHDKYGHDDNVVQIDTAPQTDEAWGLEAHE